MPAPPSRHLHGRGGCRPAPDTGRGGNGGVPSSQTAQGDGGAADTRANAPPRPLGPPLRPLVLAALLSVLGLVTYTGRPAAPPHAAGGRGGTAEGGGTAPTAPTVRADLDVRRYTVAGRTAAEVHRSMGDGGPTLDGTTYFGMTASEIGVRFRAVEADGGCRLDAVEVDLDLTMTLPAWEPAGPTDYALRRDWARFESALRRHEDGHRDRAVAGAQAVADALAGVRAATCAEADAEGQRRVREAQDRTAAEQRRYDDATDHGRTEGAAWPLAQ